MNKDYYRVRLTKFERDQKIKFAEQILHGTSRRKVLSDTARNLNILSKQLGMNNDETSFIWNKLYSDYIYTSHRCATKRDDVDRIMEVSLERLGGSYITSILNRIEARKKEQTLQVKTTPFYICTKLPDPAIDHKDYQGQIYIKQNWRDYVDDGEERKKIAAYIRNHHIRTVEYITGPPVYLLTRPNCRHKLIPVSIDLVLHSSARSILNRLPLPQKKKYKLDVKKYNENNRIKFIRAMDNLKP